MGLSSQLAPSAIARPGVIANAAARPASPYDGQVIYQQDTDQAYVWNGSAWVLLSTGTANPPGLELVKTQTIGSAVTSVTVTSAFSADFDNYRIVLNGGTTSASGYWQMRLGASTATYYGGFIYVVYSSGAVAGLGLNNAQQFSYIGGMNQGQTSINADVFSPYLSKFTYVSSSPIINGANYGQFIGDHETAASYTDFTLYTSTGTATGGTINVYGYKK